MYKINKLTNSTNETNTTNETNITNTKNFDKCAICHKYKCKYYNHINPYLSDKICYLCYGRKEVCYNSKPDLYKIYLCDLCVNNNFVNNNFLNYNFVCDKCDNSHDLCLCVNDNLLLKKYPYTVPY